jgi:hypothetical protein
LVATALNKGDLFMKLDISHIEFSSDLAIETGIHVGDGSMNVYKQGSLYTVACHHIDDKKFIDEVVLPLIFRIYGKSPKPRLWSQGTYGFRICSEEIIDFKHRVLGLPLGKKTQIEIPKQFLRDRKLFIDFLRGFFATDGCVYLWFTNNKYYPRLQMYNVSKKLILQIKENLEKMSFRVTIWKKEYKNNWNTEYKLSINGMSMLRKWVTDIGFLNPKHKLKYENLNNSKASGRTCTGDLLITSQTH